MSIAVIGGGAFGTALALSLAGKGVTLWTRSNSMEQTRISPRLPDVVVPEAIEITTDLNAACAADTLLFAVPMQSLGDVVHNIHTPLAGKTLIACCKGIDLSTGNGPVKTLQLAARDAQCGILTGPSFAREIAAGLPTALTLACHSKHTAAGVQTQLSTPNLRLYRSTDVAGAEMGGALKNVIAIACGAVIGAKLGESARAALMTRGYAEMVRFAVSRGAKAETLAGLSGFGDLALTCGSDMSRNFRYGFALGQGTEFDASTTVEGAATARALQAFPDAEQALPICTAVAKITQERLTVADAMAQLLARPLKEE